MKHTRLTLMLMTALFGGVGINTVYADDSITHSAKASKHSVLAASEGLASTATVASAVVAAPIIVTGSVVVATGSVIAESAESIARNAHTHSETASHNGPLVITETIITADLAPNKVKVTTTTTTR